MTNPNEPIRVFIPLVFKRKNGRPRIVPPDIDSIVTKVKKQDPHVLRAIGRAWAWRRRLERGADATGMDLAAAENVTDQFVSKMLRLTYLSPAVLEQLIVWHQPPAISIEEMSKLANLPWKEQMGRVFEGSTTA